MYRWDIHILLEGRHAQNLKFAPSGPPPNRHCPHKLPLSVLFPVASSSIHIKCNVECNAGEKIKKNAFLAITHPSQTTLFSYFSLQITNFLAFMANFPVCIISALVVLSGLEDNYQCYEFINYLRLPHQHCLQPHYPEIIFKSWRNNTHT